MHNAHRFEARPEVAGTQLLLDIAPTGPMSLATAKDVASLSVAKQRRELLKPTCIVIVLSEQAEPRSTIEGAA